VHEDVAFPVKLCALRAREDAPCLGVQHLGCCPLGGPAVILFQMVPPIHRGRRQHISPSPAAIAGRRCERLRVRGDGDGGSSLGTHACHVLAHGHWHSIVAFRPVPAAGRCPIVCADSLDRVGGPVVRAHTRETEQIALCNRELGHPITGHARHRQAKSGCLTLHPKCTRTPVHHVLK
jgi:hypothetical protein